MTGRREQGADGKDRLEELIEELSGLEDPDQIEAFVAARPDLTRRDVVERLGKELVRQARSDMRRAERLSRVVGRLAEGSGDDYSLATSLKARGHIEYLSGRYEEALELYRGCQERFLAAGAEIEAAMNLCSSGLWALALLGRYPEAESDLARARQILEEHGDPLLLARLTSNQATMLQRQDRHLEAIAGTERALEEFRRQGEDQDIVVALHNIAVSSIAIHDFEAALGRYHELRDHCARCGMALAAAQAEYNIAYLYFFRGEYTRAIEVYQVTRRKCEELGDPYHRTLCDLDQSEIYLELNLEDRGRRLAQRAREAFEELGNGYEAAKATAFLAIAAEQRGELDESLDLFADAKRRFALEDNRAWTAMIDFYRALLLLRKGRSGEARALGEGAFAFFLGVPWPAWAALCDLLLARIDLAERHPEDARERCAAAHRRLEELDLPALSFKAFLLQAQVAERLGDRDFALSSYRQAHAMLEDLRTHLQTEELKIAFLADKLGVFESLVWLTMEGEVTGADQRQAFEYIEQAKSRTLADLLAFRVTLLPGSAGENQELVARARSQREELSSLYHKLDQIRGLRAGGSAGVVPGIPTAMPQDGAIHQRKQVDELRRRSLEGERRLLETLGELRSTDPGLAALQSATTIDLERVQETLPSDATLLEFFEARGTIYGCRIERSSFSIRPLAPGVDVRRYLESFLFGLRRFEVPEEHLKDFRKALYQSSLVRLQQLYSALIEPFAAGLDTRHLIIVPHGPLHQVPFHALHDGERFLVDRFSFSFAPSASVFAMCSETRKAGSGPPLVLGVPDEQAPQILTEVEAVRQAVPEARVFLGAEASLDRLRELGPDCRQLHIATHGFFRQDNPMFSAIQLGDSRLTLFDLYDLRLSAELVVLSGCGTGLNVVETGDELIGLTRGFLHAGARSILVTLWDVHDVSTAAFMRSFYRHLAAESNSSRAIALAMRELRERYPEPYYWAPFVLVGWPFRGDGPPDVEISTGPR